MSEQLEIVEEEKKVFTTMTTLADEEKASGQKINLPGEEKLASNALNVYIKSMLELKNLLSDKSISKVSVMKGVMAGLDLPESDKEVPLKTRQELDIFQHMQMAINARYILTRYHIAKQLKDKEQEQQQAQQKEGD